MVLILLGPADEDSAVAVHPGVTGLNDPAPGAPTGCAGLQRELLATATNMRCETVFRRGLTNAVEVVAAIQAQPLRLLGRGLGPLDRDRVDRRL